MPNTRTSIYSHNTLLGRSPPRQPEYVTSIKDPIPPPPPKPPDRSIDTTTPVHQPLKYDR